MRQSVLRSVDSPILAPKLIAYLSRLGANFAVGIQSQELVQVPDGGPCLVLVHVNVGQQQVGVGHLRLAYRLQCILFGFVPTILGEQHSGQQ